MRLRRIACIGLIVLVAAAVAGLADGGRLRLATTTSTDNSGLLSVMIPPFEKKTGLKVDVIAVGTGKALELGQKGDVDVVLVHAREAEDAFVAAGFGVNRRDVMHNDFIILGPAQDPAGVRGLKDAVEALKRIAARQASFVSRGDNSGTDIMEKSLWAKADLKPQGRWYKEAGQGMGAVITMSQDLGAYTLADRGTYLSMKSKVSLQILVEGDPLLFNPYGIIAVNPARQPHVNYDGAMAFIAWFTSPEGQKVIGDYKIGGEVLFFPDAVKQ
jgi:tungstate transport system substrate-binding protein